MGAFKKRVVDRGVNRDSDSWKTFVLDTKYRWCWLCGRSQLDQPVGWYAPWLLERSHIVSSPRREDARAVVLLCSLCHRLSHGIDVRIPGEVLLPGATVSEMLWLKRRFDASRYDRGWLQLHCVGRLPRAVRPKLSVLSEYHSRRRLPCLIARSTG